MMSGAMSTTPDPAMEARLRLRAQWLCTLSQADLERLQDMTLREVDDLFARWLDRAGERAA
jgi:hypothetical protein